MFTGTPPAGMMHNNFQASAGDFAKNGDAWELAMPARDVVVSATFVELIYENWAAANGVAGAWDAADARGIHNVFRYAFNVPTGDFALLGIAFNDDGKAVILTPPLVNSADFAFSVVVSDNVNGTGNSATYDLQPSGETVINETGKSRRFFRLRAVEQ